MLGILLLPCWSMLPPWLVRNRPCAGDKYVSPPLLVGTGDSLGFDGNHMGKRHFGR